MEVNNVHPTELTVNRQSSSESLEGQKHMLASWSFQCSEKV